MLSMLALRNLIDLNSSKFLLTKVDLDRHVPMAVGGGVLTTSNYEARKYGVRSAMPGYIAKKLCPQLIILPADFTKYTAKGTSSSCSI
jgi:DNA polymerase kappa